MGLQPWYTPIGSNCKNIALELSRHNRILYINSPLDRRTVLQKSGDPDIAHHIQVSKGKAPSLVQVKENFWNLYPLKVLESVNWLPKALFAPFNRINNKRYAKDIRKAIRETGFKNYILFNDNDMFRGFYMKELLEPEMYIYYSRDNLAGTDFFKKHGAGLEPRHIAKADLAVANSLYLNDLLLKYNSNSHYIGQGCELGLFDAGKTHEKPADMQNIRGKVIGYVGALTAMRLDPGIIMEISQKRPDWNIVLVGPEDEAFAASALHRQANVHFLGRKPLPELASYMAHFDVCINPQLLNEMTMGNYPLKVDEYLAMGKPVVATSTKTMSLFKDHVYLAERPADYVPLIEKALAETDPAIRDSRIRFARSHTWENSVGELYRAIQLTAAQKKNA